MNKKSTNRTHDEVPQSPNGLSPDVQNISMQTTAVSKRKLIDVPKEFKKTDSKAASSFVVAGKSLESYCVIIMNNQSNRPRRCW